MKLKYTKLHPEAKTPTRGSAGAAAYDLYSMENVYIPPGETALVRTGVAMRIPEGWKGEVYSRSGLASKGILVANSPGKIDSDYRGEIKVILHNSRKELVGIQLHDRIAQFEINPVHDIEFEQTENLELSERGDKGFGSTGR
jgi:dUTP pyrophosphatase